MVGESLRASMEPSAARLDRLQGPTIETPRGERYDRFPGHADETLPIESMSDDLLRPGRYRR